MLTFFPVAAKGQQQQQQQQQKEQEPSAVVSADCLVIAPSSHGNVGQLAVDIIVSSYASSSSATARSEVELLGWLDSDHHVSVAGNETFTRTRSQQEPQKRQLCLPLELYGLGRSSSSASEEEGGSGRLWRAALLQTRSPLLRGRGAAFVHELVAWAKGTGAFDRIVVVVGAAPMAEEMLTGARLGYSFNVHAHAQHALMESVRAWERLGAVAAGNSGGAQSGTAALLLQVCSSEAIAAAALYMFVAEGGDNAADGARLAHVLLESLVLAGQQKLVPVPLVPPRSWECLFGLDRRHEMEAL
jgi:hypothetical protein